MSAPEPFQMDVSQLNFPQIYLPQDSTLSSQDCASSQPPPPQPQPPPPSTSPPPPISSQPAPRPPPSPVSSGYPATVQHQFSTPPVTRFPEHLMHKNRLQEFTQRSNIALPMYQTVNEGTQHAPRFRSTVWVDGMSYTSQITFPQRKAAEQDVARLALECQSKKIKDEGRPLVCEYTLFSKSILNEYATKLNVDRPTYNTVQQEGSFPVFVSSLVFNGTRYTGDAARNKKEAEQLAARAVILSILGNSGSGTLYEIIKSKSKIYGAVKPNNQQCSDASIVSAIPNTGHTSFTQDHKDKEVAGLVAANNTETKVELPNPSKMLSSCQENLMPKQEPPLEPEGTKLPNASLQPGSEQPIGDCSSLRKRRKNKKKAGKKARLESPSPITAFPLNKVAPCSMAQ